MNNSRKIPHWSGIAIIIFVCVALVLNCGDIGTNPRTKLQDLYFTTQITGWVPDSSSHFTQFPIDSLYGPKDGDAPVYKDAGCVWWFREKMNGGPTATFVGGDYVFIGYVMDFGTTAKAKALYDVKVATNVTPFPSAKVTLGQYSDNEAQASLGSAGIQVYAIFGKFYFEFNIMGFQVPADAVPEALKFLDKYKATIY